MRQYVLSHPCRPLCEAKGTPSEQSGQASTWLISWHSCQNLNEPPGWCKSPAPVPSLWVSEQPGLGCSFPVSGEMCWTGHLRQIGPHASSHTPPVGEPRGLCSPFSALRLHPSLAVSPSSAYTHMHLLLPPHPISHRAGLGPSSAEKATHAQPGLQEGTGQPLLGLALLPLPTSPTPLGGTRTEQPWLLCSENPGGWMHQHPPPARPGVQPAGAGLGANALCRPTHTPGSPSLPSWVLRSQAL